MNARLIVRKVASSFLVLPAVITAALLALSVSANRLDPYAQGEWTRWVFRGSFANARALLQSIAAGAVTLTGLVFSITMLVLQLASAQYSPRVLHSFLDDRTSQVTLGLMVGTFAYALSSIRVIDETSSTQPGLSVSIAVVLAIVMVGAFVWYINHIAHRIQATSIIARVAADTEHELELRRAIDPDADAIVPELGGVLQTVCAPTSAVLLAVNRKRLLECAGRAGAVIVLCEPVGAFIPRGAPLVKVHRQCVDEQSVLDSLRFGAERTLVDDPTFGFRQLVDIALRSLSPSMNDPTTAAQALERLHALLRLVISLPETERYVVDERGEVRVCLIERRFSDYVDLTFDELLQSAESYVQVRAKLRSVLDDLVCMTHDDERRRLLLAKRLALQ